MIKKFLLSLLILIAATSAAHAEESDFNSRKANLTEINAIRVGYGSEMVRIVLDMTKKIEYTESYAEFPSRMVIDFKNAWLNPTVPREIILKSFVAKKIRIAQFDPSTVRLVIETMAETNLFYLDGGPKGQRFIIDLGNNAAAQKPEAKTPEAKQTDTSQQERELQEKHERELQEKHERELQEKHERELQEKHERELQEKQERELQEKHARELREKLEREIREKVEREFKEKQERELKEKRERERKEKEERELKEKRERELKEKRERERKEKEERELKEKREREKKEKREREKREKEKKSKDKAKDDEKDTPPAVTEIDTDLREITALSGKKIVIDPGHGGNDAGAIGPTGVMEKTVTLKVALELRRLLEAEGAEVIMTRETDRTVSDKGAAASDIEELGARCDVANRIRADIFISIHADSFTRPEARGTTGYYYSKSTTGRGQRLADCIRRNLVEQLGTPSRGTQPCNFFVVKNTDMPATLIELGFISNKDEEKLLDSAEGVKKAAQGILDGIEDYFG